MLSGLLAIAHFSRREGSLRPTIVNLFGAGVVAFTIVVNLRRGYPIASLVASALVGGAFAWLWIRQGRPRGIAQAERVMEIDLAQDETG